LSEALLTLFCDSERRAIDLRPQTSDRRDKMARDYMVRKKQIGDRDGNSCLLSEVGKRQFPSFRD
jgi:hypothetical protein